VLALQAQVARWHFANRLFNRRDIMAAIGTAVRDDRDK
jgi:hypothetical protein